MRSAGSLLPKTRLDSYSSILERLFLQHQYDWILASNGLGKGQKPNWYTLDYSLNLDQLNQCWQNKNRLIGVSFGSTTSYAVLDIDAGSSYCNIEQIKEIRAVLENIGIVRTTLIQSSHSEGLHLYIPLPEPVNTFSLAVALRATLESKGFIVKAGTLEVFPNVKTYAGGGQKSRYRAHRIPLQPGSDSFILDDSLNSVGVSLETFARYWNFDAESQNLDIIKKVLESRRRQFYENLKKHKPSRSWWVSQKAQSESFVEEGWTGGGQTNYLLGKFAWYGRACLGVTGPDLVNYIVDRAQRSPGYAQYCGHQHEIEKRARDWAKFAERKHKDSHQSKRRGTEKSAPKQNQNVLKAEEAKQRLLDAMKILQEENRLPATTKKRLEALIQAASISSRTLYKDEYKPLWHPDFWVEVASAAPGPIEQEGPSLEAEMGGFAAELANLSNESPEPLINKSSKEFYTCPLMKLLPSDLGQQKADLCLGVSSATRDQYFQGTRWPKNEKIWLEGELENCPRELRSPQPSSSSETSPYCSAKQLPACGKSPFLPQAADRVRPLNSSPYGLIQLALVPGAEVTADTPEQLTGQLRALQCLGEEKRLQEADSDSRNLSSA